MENRLLSRVMCASMGVELIQITEGGIVPFAVVGLGAGLTLAVVDHLAKCYPQLELWAADLPGEIGFEVRCLVLDYIICTWPSLLLMWSSLRSGADYPRYLREYRMSDPQALWVYSKGWDEQEATREWLALGAQVVENLWQENPLGSLTPTLLGLPVGSDSEGRL